MPVKTHESPWASAFAPRAAGERRYWLVKSEPTTYSFDDLMASPNKTTNWDGIRNPVARNFMRDGMQVGDRVFFYHSSVNPQVIVGVCEVVRAGYPEADDPSWFMVDLKAIAPLPRPVTLAEIKKLPQLANMPLVRIGRLSVSPVTATEWKTICELGGAPAALAK